jgi:hypothetical protein
MFKQNLRRPIAILACAVLLLIAFTPTASAISTCHNFYSQRIAELRSQAEYDNHMASVESANGNLLWAWAYMARASQETALADQLQAELDVSSC